MHWKSLRIFIKSYRGPWSQDPKRHFKLVSTQKDIFFLLFAGWEVRILQTCEWGLENAAPAWRQAEGRIFKSEVTGFHYTDLRAEQYLYHASLLIHFYDYWPFHTLKSSARSRTLLRTTQIAGFATVPCWKKKIRTEFAAGLQRAALCWSNFCQKSSSC